jgi:hypothetical protein
MALTLQQFNLKNLRKNRPEVPVNKPAIKLPVTARKVISNTSSGNFSLSPQDTDQIKILTINGDVLTTIAEEDIIGIT